MVLSFLPLLLLSPSLLSPTHSAPMKIPLTSDNVIGLFGYDKFTPATNLLDEQEFAGDPLNNPGGAGKCKNSWNPTWDAPWYPTQNPWVPGPAAALDLGKSYVVEHVFIYHDYGGYSFNVSYAATNPLQDRHVLSTGDTSSWLQGWHRLNITAQPEPIRFIRFNLLVPPGDSFLEVVVYGTAAASVEDDVVLVKPEAAPASPLSLLLGTNAFGWTPIDQYAAVGAVREYQDWQFSDGGEDKNYPGYPNNRLRFECIAQGGFCYDTYLANVTSLPLAWHHCAQGTPGWVHGWNQAQESWKPLSQQQLRTAGMSVQPSSYVMLADHMFQVAARYGRTKVNDALLKLAPNRSSWDATPQPRVSGTNRLTWVEPLNEPDAWWRDRETFYSNEEYAAAMSASYDGHCRTMPSSVGVKQADPTMKMSLSGLAGAGKNARDRLQTVLWWSQVNRADKAFPGEAVNVHVYANDGKIGISPEQFGLAELIAKLTAWRDTHLPNVEVWVTEYGYDTHPGSPQSCPAIGATSAEVVQGQWLLRSVLAFARAGNVQRAHQYMMGDVATGSSGLYATSGLVDSHNQYKPSWYHFHCMNSRLGKFFHLSSSCKPASGGDVCVAAFGRTPSDTPTAYAVWSPTASGRTLQGFVLNVGGSWSGSVTIVTPTDKVPLGVEAKATVTAGSVTLPMVSEMPVFVLQS